jgi:hypothetical protein
MMPDEAILAGVLVVFLWRTLSCIVARSPATGENGNRQVRPHTIGVEILSSGDFGVSSHGTDVAVVVTERSADVRGSDRESWTQANGGRGETDPESEC